VVALRHPLSGTRYERTPDGHVCVGEGDDAGLFTADGQWISGVRRAADPQLCRWVAEGEPRKVPARFAAPPTS
jgi:hypothetical protein